MALTYRYECECGWSRVHENLVKTLSEHRKMCQKKITVEEQEMKIGPGIVGKVTVHTFTV